MASSALLAAALAVLAPAAPETPLATANRVSKDYAKAVKTEDLVWFERHTAPDMTYTTRKGVKQDRASILTQMKGAFASASFDRVAVKVLSARKAEGGVLVLSDTMVNARIQGPGGKTSKLESTTREESLWVPKGKDWQVKRIKELKDSTKIDGKPMGG